MICTNCFEAEYHAAKTELTITVNGESHVLADLACETCPACGEVTFTHAQSLEIDKKRIALEFALKPLLTPEQLKTLRRVLNMKLDEICDLLQVGRNTYGRWERGEVAITPSMNLLVHNFIEKFPDVWKMVLGAKGEKDAALNNPDLQRSMAGHVPAKGKRADAKEVQQVCRENGETYSSSPESRKGSKTEK